MSALRPSPTTPGAFLCPRCGNALRDDQAWCLECGLAARTRVHPPPSWRAPVIATVVALALLAAGIAFALVALLDDPERTPAPTTVTVPAATPPPATTPPAATTPVTPPPTTTPGATTPSTTPGATTPTTPGATTPSTTTPAPAGRGRTFTIPGTGIELPATGGDGG
ncbi:MAG TPA: hypothetical protein VK506_03085 [Conexibacter sp.]|nr:hypothetical protein [Conexibacter sp.]